MWTEEQRRLYQREGEVHPSDLRDAEWARLEPLIPQASPGKGVVVLPRRWVVERTFSWF